MEFNDVILHESGEILDVPRRLREALSWEISSELVRRHPEELMLAELQPGGGQYDCMTIVSLHGEEMSFMNRISKGHINVALRHTLDDRPNWTQVLLADDRRTVVELIESDMGLLAPRETPLTTSRSIGYRVIAEMILQKALSKNSLFASHGWYDGEMHELNAKMTYFEAVPMAHEALRASKAGELFKSPAANFWFVFELEPSKQHTHFLEFDANSKPPLFAVDCYKGMLHGPRLSIDLMAEYKANDRNLEKLIRAIYIDLDKVQGR
jgi:hypothetical protein